MIKYHKSIDIPILLWYYHIMKIEKKEVSEMSREELINENKELQIKCDNLTLEINNLKRIVFGSKRENTPTTESINTDQCSFFDNEEDIEKDVQEELLV